MPLAIPHALEVIAHVEDGGQGAQVVGGRLTSGDYGDDVTLDLIALLIDGLVAFQNPLGGLEIMILQGSDRIGHGLFHHAAEDQEGEKT
jgi:hypothetical protein